MLSHDALQVSGAQGCSGVRSLKAVCSDAGREEDAQPAHVNVISVQNVEQHIMTRQDSHMQTQQHCHSALNLILHSESTAKLVGN